MHVLAKCRKMFHMVEPEEKLRCLAFLSSAQSHHSQLVTSQAHFIGEVRTTY